MSAEGDESKGFSSPIGTNEDPQLEEVVPKKSIQDDIRISSTWDQFVALARKSFIAQKRQYKTNLCQILFPLLLIIVLFLLQILVDNLIQSEFGGRYRDAIRNPMLYPDQFIHPVDSCANFPLSANPFRGRIGAIGDAATLGTFPNMTNYEGGSGIFGSAFFEAGATAHPAIPSRGLVRQFDIGAASKCDSIVLGTNPELLVYSDLAQAKDDIFEYWTDHKKSYLGLYDLRQTDLGNNKVDMTLYFNKTLTEGEDLPAVASFVVNTIYRVLRGETSPSVFFRNTGYMDYPTRETEVSFDIISVAGPFIYLYVFQLLLPVFMSNQVLEKELKLREIMRMMGLKTPVYWVVNYLFNYALYLVATFLIILVAALLGFRVFTQNVFISYFALFFIWGHVMVVLAWVFSAFLTSATTATVVGYLYVFATGILSSTLIQSFYENPDTPQGTIIVTEILPSFTFYRGLWALRDGVFGNQDGYTMANLKETDWVPLQEVYIVLIIEWFLLLLLAMYLDLVFGGSGSNRSCCFCFRRGESPCLKDEEKSTEITLAPPGSLNVIDNGDLNLPSDAYFPEDIELVRNNARNDVDAPVRILDLVKVFPSRDGGEFRAVNNLSMTVNDAECFGFLGPNGAGKSTTMNMLCGYLKPDAGTAFLAGKDIRMDVDQVHMLMGVCPQDNVLWTDLTSGEHLEFYGRIKGLTGDALEKAIVRGLEEVQLLEVRNKKCGEYSGGMKRRLCVAIALIGNPRIILLDEPTTGLDPGARRSLWAVVKRAKQQASVLLTTHSMEEAEALCDRMAVVQDGQLTVVDSSANLKQRFVHGYKLSITLFDPAFDVNVQDLVKKHAPDAVLLSNIGGVLNFELPKATTKLATVFDWMEANKKQNSIIDWALSNTTLEEAFVYISTGGYAKEVEEKRQNLNKLMESADPLQ